MLKYHAHLLAVKVDVYGFIGQIDPVEVYLAGGRLFKQIQRAQHCGFAGAGRAYDRHNLAALHVKTAIVKRFYLAVVILLYKVPDRNKNVITAVCRHGAFSSLWPQYPWRPGNLCRSK